ncbi:hypothetical protein C8034_v004408 [Colletotrichum sidae]|uniref:Bacteriocin-protection protein n=1 Tax=Colletotrichum sidae TaxID=1347389 RepID=A0A4R8T7R5_9PEZI|nr:hypothetical protein C8034_v004408 [Colletotrichum sidae]
MDRKARNTRNMLPEKERGGRIASRRGQSGSKGPPPPSVESPEYITGSGSQDFSKLFDDQKAWETWLEKHHGEEKGVWLKIAKIGAKIPSVTYNEAVDVALCFGWIDGQRRAHDEEYFTQRFTPRRKHSMWSQRNVDKVAELIKAERMRGPGQAVVDAAMADGRWTRAYSSSTVAKVPLDFQQALEGDEKARNFFDALNKTKRFAFLWRVATIKKPETRQRKIREYVGMLSEHRTL